MTRTKKLKPNRTSIAEFLRGEEKTLNKLHFHLPHLDSVEKLQKGAERERKGEEELIRNTPHPHSRQLRPEFGAKPPPEYEHTWDSREWGRTTETFSDTKTQEETRMNNLVKLSLWLLGLFSLLLNIALLIGYLRRTPQCATRSKNTPQRKHDQSSLVFADLSRDEYLQVQEYLLRQKDLNISTRLLTKPNENYLFLIDLHVPNKTDVLKHLDAQGSAPRREATVVVFYGAKDHIKEYVVGPLPNPNSHRDVTRERYGKELPLSARPFTIGEYILLFKILKEKLFVPLRLSGYYIQPVGFEVLVDHHSTNMSEWRVERLFYNGQYFMSVEELRDAYSAGTVDKIVKTPWEDYGSLKPRTRPLQLGPQLMSPEGARYSVRHNQVLYLDWSFAFGLSAVTGMRVFDVRFRNERILYELSVQEAMSVYGSVTPGMGMTKFLDSGSGIGRFAHELMRGVDCPYDLHT
ncbi:hypothetical protein WMY93_013973 [Mugilogobius chulae]|uniref:Amine oxidase n=1 Tax=Mugilogobius chulae TaxID=88201 RepID=A0AAW0NVN6_9GOBI